MLSRSEGGAATGLPAVSSFTASKATAGTSSCGRTSSCVSSVLVVDVGCCVNAGESSDWTCCRDDGKVSVRIIRVVVGDRLADVLASEVADPDVEPPED